MNGYDGNETILHSTRVLLILYNDEKEGSSEFIGFGKKDTSRRTTSSPSRGFTIILPIPKSGPSRQDLLTIVYNTSPANSSNSTSNE
jgi:hypothetical protein